MKQAVMKKVLNRMNARKVLPLLLLALALTVLGCDSRTQRTDSGGVVLQLDLGTQFPFRVSVNQSTALQLNLTLNSIVADPVGNSSPLMDVEIKTMEVLFSRADNGTILPPVFVRDVAGRVPVGGNLNYLLTVMSTEQFRGAPLADLLFSNGGFDKETGNTNIKLNLLIRFFGRTVGGRDIESNQISQQIEFTQ